MRNPGTSRDHRAPYETLRRLARPSNALRDTQASYETLRRLARELVPRHESRRGGVETPVGRTGVAVGGGEGLGFDALRCAGGGRGRLLFVGRGPGVAGVRTVAGLLLLLQD